MKSQKTLKLLFLNRNIQRYLVIAHKKTQEILGVFVYLGRLTRFERANDRFTAGSVRPLHHNRQNDNYSIKNELFCKEIFLAVNLVIADVIHPREIRPHIKVES